MAKRFRRLKHYLIPHAGNMFKPGVFARESVAVLVLGLILVEGAYFFGTHILLQNAGFTAAVLPAALTDLTNADRAAAGHIALSHDPRLAQAAQKKAEDMAAKGYFSHVSPEGRTPWYWLEAVGYEYTYAGENLAINFTDSMDVEEAWMNSPEHHANIVKPEYTQIGIGTARGMYQGQETVFVVELFAALPDRAAAPVASKGVQVPKSVAASPAAPSAAPERTRVLGAQVGGVSGDAADDNAAPASSGGSLFATIASSPNHVVTWIFSIFAALIGLLLGIAIFAKRKVHYLEAAGGVILIGAALAFIFLNSSGISDVQIPSDSQAASVSLAL